MALDSVESMLRKAVDVAIKSAVSDLTEEAIKGACADFELALRHKMATYAVEITRYIQVETHGENLVITVHQPGGMR